MYKFIDLPNVSNVHIKKKALYCYKAFQQTITIVHVKFVRNAAYVHSCLINHIHILIFVI